MAGARGRSGGKRAGAGRPKGTSGGGPRGISKTTRDQRAIYDHILAGKARQLHRQALALWRAGKGADPGAAPSRDDVVASTAFRLELLVRAALHGDGLCARHIDERCAGRVPQGHEVAGPQGSAIEIKVRIVETVSEDAEE